MIKTSTFIALPIFFFLYLLFFRNPFLSLFPTRIFFGLLFPLSLLFSIAVHFIERDSPFSKQCTNAAKQRKGKKKKQKYEFYFFSLTGSQQRYVGETVSMLLGLLRERWLMLLMVSPRLFSPNSSSSSSSSFPSLSQWFHAGGREEIEKDFEEGISRLLTY